MLRKAIDERGLTSLIAKSDKDAMRHVITELEGREAENDFDPLMTCNNMIWAAGLEEFGLELMKPGEEQCPICLSLTLTERWWIDGPANSVLKEAKDKGLIS